MITIGDLISKEVQTIIDKEYKNDSCKPTFIISNMFKNSGFTLILTITHLGWSQSGIIGFETDIKELVILLYNRTM